jgi:hypothetical protein
MATRSQLIQQLGALKEEHPEWGQKIEELIQGFENDEISLAELEELIADYRRRVENDASIQEVVIRTRAEVCLEMLLSLAKAVA